MSGTVFTGIAHDDHDLTEEQINFVQNFPPLLDRPSESFILEVVPLPENLGTVPCALYGPAAGDEPVGEDDVFYEQRGDRKGPSRMIAKPFRPAKNLVVIGLRDGVCFTMYGTQADKASPREPWDAREDNEHELCKAFWAQHALADPEAATRPRSLPVRDVELAKAYNVRLAQ